MPNLRCSPYCRLVIATLCVLLWCASGLRAQVVDLNGNGMSDIWEQVYGASTLPPNGDADNDGASNLQEAVAGTDPFDPNSKP